MTIRKMMYEKTKCEGCKNCNHYPYFHFDRTKDSSGIDIEYIKFDTRSAKAINHTSGVVHIYDGQKWIQQ